MAPGRDDDLDWLYGRGQQPAAGPEPTQIMPASQETAPRASRVPAPQVPAVPGSTAVQPATPPASPNYPGTPGRPPAQAPKKRHPVRNTFLVLGIVLLAIIVGLVGIPAYAWSQVQRVDETPSGARPGDQPGTTFLLVGSDSREGLSAAERKSLGTGRTAGQRTDTIMILYIPAGGKPALISVPRDSYVPIPQHGKNKINAAYAFGGPKLLVETIEQNTGLRMDGYLEIGFGGFVNVIEAVGGIEMCLPKAIKDRDSHLDLPEGCQTLNGIDALGYVRMRKADPRGDLGRVERQRAILAAVAKKAASPSSILNPVRYWRLSNATADSLRLGQKTSLVNMMSLGLAMKKVAGGQGLTLTVPIADPSASTGAGSAVLWNTKQARAMFGDIARGDTSGLAKYAK